VSAAGSTPEQPAAAGTGGTPTRRDLGVEVLLLLGVSLGASAVWALLEITNRLTQNVRLADQQATLNESATPDRPWLDLAYQLAGVGLGVIPALLAVYLLHRTHPPAWRTIGLDRRRPGLDLGGGLALTALIGVPGLGLYLLARALGAAVDVVPAALGEHWWSVPVLVLAALENSLVEEVIVVGYLLVRLEQFGWPPVALVAASALLRGTYHLYQGFGGFVGNLAMGVIFALVFLRFRRVGPLVVAHLLIDVCAFVGYALLGDHLSWL